MPSLRFDGWISRNKPADTRNTKELLANIDYFAEKLPEVAKLKKELKSMNPKHLSLVSDICELTKLDLNGKNINIRKTPQNGKSLFGHLMEILPKASKENPESLDFVQEVINHTDTTAAKYFLYSCPGYFVHTEAAQHLAATKPLVRDIADAAFEGLPRLDYAKEKLFVDTIKNFVNPSVNPENIETLQKVCEIADKQGKQVDAIAFVRNNVNLY